MPLDKIIQSYVNQYGLDYVRALKLTEKQKDYLISENIQFLIKQQAITPNEALSVVGRAYNIVHYKNICKLIALKKLELQQAIALFKEDCDKIEIDNIFYMVAEGVVELQSICRLQEPQVAILKNDSIIELIRLDILSFEQAIQLNAHNCRYFFSKEMLVLFNERNSLSFEQIKSLKPREFKNIIRLFAHIDINITLGEILNFKQLQSDIIHCDRIFKLIPEDIQLKQALAFTHEQLSYFESDEIYPLIEKGFISIEELLSIQNSLLFNHIIRDIIASNPSIARDVVCSPSHKEQSLLNLLSFNEFPDLLKKQQVSLETCFSLENHHNLLLNNPKFIELLKLGHANMAQFINFEMNHCRLLSERLNQPHLFSLIKQKLISMTDIIILSDYQMKALKYPPLEKLIQLGLIAIDSFLTINKEQCASLLDKLSITPIFNQFTTCQIGLYDLVTLPLDIDPSVSERLNHKYPLVSASIFYSPPIIYIQLPEHIETISKTKLS